MIAHDAYSTMITDRCFISQSFASQFFVAACGEMLLLTKGTTVNKVNLWNPWTTTPESNADMYGRTLGCLMVNASGLARDVLQTKLFSRKDSIW